MWIIEQLVVGDWERLRALRLRALDDEPDAFGSSFARESGYDESDWRRLLESGPFWVAVVDGSDIGIVAGGRHREHHMPWVFSMWVEATWRGHGVATSLLDRVVEWAASDATRLGLDVADRVPRAKRFYERYGFVESDGRLPMPRDTTITLIEMYLDLPARRGESHRVGAV